MTIYLQLSAIFAFGLVISGIVFVGILRAREQAARNARVEAAVDDDNDKEFRVVAGSSA